LARTCPRILPKRLFSDCVDRISRHCTMGRPASIMVANRRVKMTMSLTLTPVPMLKLNWRGCFLTATGCNC
jgi:hypothetical protein